MLDVGQAQHLAAHESGCVAFTYCSRHGVPNIFVLHDGVGGEAPPVAATAHASSQLKISGVAFTRDGHSIIFVTQPSGAPSAVTLWIVAVPAAGASTAAPSPPRRLDCGAISGAVAVRPAGASAPSAPGALADARDLVAYVKKGQVWVASTGSARTPWSPAQLCSVKGHCAQLAWRPPADAHEAASPILAMIVERIEAGVAWSCAAVHRLDCGATKLVSPGAHRDSCLCWSPPLDDDCAAARESKEAEDGEHEEAKASTGRVAQHRALAFVRSPLPAMPALHFSACPRPRASVPFEIWAVLDPACEAKLPSAGCSASRLWRADAEEAGSVFRSGGIPLLWLPASSSVGDGTGSSRLLFPWERTGSCHMHCLAINADSDFRTIAAAANAVDATPGAAEVRGAIADLDGEHMYFTAALAETPGQLALWRTAAPQLSSTGETAAASVSARRQSSGSMHCVAAPPPRRVWQPSEADQAQSAEVSMEWSPVLISDRGALRACGIAFLRSSPSAPAHVVCRRWGGEASGVRTHTLEARTMEPEAAETELRGAAASAAAAVAAARRDSTATAGGAAATGSGGGGGGGGARRNSSLWTPPPPSWPFGAVAEAAAATASGGGGGSSAGPLHDAVTKARGEAAHAVRLLDSCVPGVPVTFGAADGKKAHGVLFTPPAGARAALIAVVSGAGTSGASASVRRQFVGCWPASSHYHRVYAAVQAAVAAGLVVLVLNQRGTTGFGLEHREAAGQRQFGDAAASCADASLGAVGGRQPLVTAEQQRGRASAKSGVPNGLLGHGPCELGDVAGALRYLTASAAPEGEGGAAATIADPGRVGVWGIGAYGGCLAALSLPLVGSGGGSWGWNAGIRPACAVATGGCFNQRTLLELQAPQLVRLAREPADSQAELRTYFGMMREAALSMLAAAQAASPYAALDDWPVGSVGAAPPSLLLVHGDSDPSAAATLGDAMSLTSALRSLSPVGEDRCELAVVAGADASFAQRELWEEATERALRFFCDTLLA